MDDPSLQQTTSVMALDGWMSEDDFGYRDCHCTKLEIVKENGASRGRAFLESSEHKIGISQKHVYLKQLAFCYAYINLKRRVGCSRK